MDFEDIIEDNLKDALPNYPYKKNWHQVTINELLAKAITQGYDSISFSPSIVMKQRYADRYGKFYELLYDDKIPSYLKKLARRYKGKFEKGKLDTNDLFGMADETPEIADANILKITPEMKELVEEKGLLRFNKGGIVSFKSKKD